MKILFCTDSLVAGGVEQQLVELIRRLDRERYTPVVVCLYGERCGRSLHFLPQLKQLEVPVIVLDQVSKVRLLVSLIRVAGWLQPDLIQAVNYHGGLLMRLARPFLSRRVRLISGVYVPYTRKQLAYERLTGWLCDVVVCNSPAIWKQLLLVRRRRLELIFNGVDIERFANASRQHLRSELASDARYILLFVGRMSLQKSPALIVEALGLLRERGALPDGVQLWIVGEQSETEAQCRLEDAVRRCGLGTVVRQFPATSEPEVYYQVSEAVVLSSLWEGLPNVVLEALAAGRPMVLSEAANAAGVVQHGRTGWVAQTGDVASLADQLASAMSLLPEERTTWGEACRRAAVPFCVERMVERYIALYDRLSTRS